MTANDVPMAVFISKPAKSTNAGRMRNPPPTPRKPVSTPTAMPVARQRTGRHSWVTAFDSLFRNNRLPATSISAPNSRSSMGAETRWVNFAPINAPTIPLNAKNVAALKSKAPCRRLSSVPTTLVPPTITSDMPTACWTGIPATYTSTGSVMIEPPLPSKPSDKPTSPASMSAKMSMGNKVTSQPACRPSPKP